MDEEQRLEQIKKEREAKRKMREEQLKKEEEELQRLKQEREQRRKERIQQLQAQMMDSPTEASPNTQRKSLPEVDTSKNRSEEQKEEGPKKRLSIHEKQKLHLEQQEKLKEEAERKKQEEEEKRKKRQEEVSLRIMRRMSASSSTTPITSTYPDNHHLQMLLQLLLHPMNVQQRAGHFPDPVLYLLPHRQNQMQTDQNQS
jgi:hypothetical protein